MKPFNRFGEMKRDIFVLDASLQFLGDIISVAIVVCVIQLNNASKSCEKD